MHWTRRWGIVSAAPLLACTLLGGTAGDEPTLTADGLRRVNSRAGVLFIKPEHNMGGYDSWLLPPIQVFYRRGESKLPAEYEQSIASQLHDAIRGYLESGGHGFADAAGPCVLEIRAQLIDLSLVDVDVASSRAAAVSVGDTTVGNTKVILEFRDAQSGEVVVRFGQRRDFKRSFPGSLARSRVPPTYFRRSFDRTAQDVAGVIRDTLLAEEIAPVKSVCTGRIGRIAREIMASE